MARWALDGALDAAAAGSGADAKRVDFMVRRCKPPHDTPASLWRSGFALEPGMQVWPLQPLLRMRMQGNCVLQHRFQPG